MSEINKYFRDWLSSGFDFESFVKLRTLILKDADYNFYKDTTTQLVEWLDLEEYQKIVDQCKNAGVNEILCPGFHKYIGIALKRQGNLEGFKAETAIYSYCIKMILQCGEGTLQKPYQVLRISDEYEVMKILQKQMAKQSLISQNDKHYDMIECTDGSILYFDVSVSKNSVDNLMLVKNNLLSDTMKQGDARSNTLLESKESKENYHCSNNKLVWLIAILFIVICLVMIFKS
ncbi:hypothetical protein [Candidatus Uabimicrobium sp. HlEnr_7]|uniref:hypothetical protein n=1 Tax=Candidatus Uabimicrobium helgolandensis TaxID=3095367 RepID=UPI003557443F